MRKELIKAYYPTLLKYLKRLPSYVLLLVIFLLILVYAGALGPMPSKKALREIQNHTGSEVYSADGVLLGTYVKEDRIPIKYQDLPPQLVQALIATEDARFYEHEGIDYRSLARVFIKSLILDDESSGGGSTLSQQIAKNIYPRPRLWLFSTPISKLREMIIASRLEDVYTKEEIIALYFNTVPMGEDVFGIERAAERFFNTTTRKLSLEQSALLVGMLKANTSYSPRLYPERSKQRRNVVLNKMVKWGYLEEAVAEKAKKSPLHLHYRVKRKEAGIAPYFREKLKLELEAWCKAHRKSDGTPYNLYRDGLKIVTTLDANLQKHAERAVKVRMSGLQQQLNQHWRGRSPWKNEAEGMDKLMRRSQKYQRLKAAGKSEEEIKKIFQTPVPMKLFSWDGLVKRTLSPMDSLRYYELFLNTGLVSVEPVTGYVKAWVGGINHRIFKWDHVRSKRPVGSVFKPIVYAAALENGVEPCATYTNEKVSYPEYENWTPRNANGKYEGQYTLRKALAHSVNTISAKLLMETGMEETIELARRMGIKSELPEVPSLALGAADISLLEMVTAYTVFVNQGLYIEPVSVLSITDRGGKILFQHKPERDPEEALDEELAATMLHLMQGVVEEGSARRLRREFGLQMDIAGKTGTTQNHSDGWFIGITPDLVTGVWVGAENPLIRFRTLRLGQGSNTALPLWGDFMLRLSRDREFRQYRYSRFDPLDEELLAKLDCERYEKEKQEGEASGFFKKVLGFFGFPDQAEEARKKQEQKAAESREQLAKARKRQLEWERKRAEKAREQEQKMQENQLKEEQKLLKELQDQQASAPDTATVELEEPLEILEENLDIMVE